MHIDKLNFKYLVYSYDKPVGSIFLSFAYSKNETTNNSFFADFIL